MSSLKKSSFKTEPTIYIDETNYDPMDTLAPLIQMGNFPKGTVADTPENRANAALACCAQLTRQILTLTKRVYELENGTDRQLRALKNRVYEVDQLNAALTKRVYELENGTDRQLRALKNRVYELEHGTAN